LPGVCESRLGTLESFDDSETFDTILYMDVLEHIEDDRGEVARAAKHLRPGGHVIALSPAHQWLSTPFDQAIGHCRRYSKATFGALKTDDLEKVCLVYLDSIGFFASLANKLMLKSAMPKPSQIAFWDNVLVRISRVVDPVLGFSAGKSVLAVWRKK
jgi:SAM-dependent methyltransferase